MAKRGQTLPWKVEFQYDTMPKPSKNAKPGKWDALYEGRQIARRGAEVWIYHQEPTTGYRTNLAHYDADNPPPETDDDLR